MDYTIFKSPYSLTNKSKLQKGNSNDMNNLKNNDNNTSQDHTELIMQDILTLLNLDIIYKERISQINTLNKKKNLKELNLIVISTTLKYEQNSYLITPFGLKNSKRNSKDGIVLFGYEKKGIIVF